MTQPLDTRAIRASMPAYTPDHWTAPNLIRALCDDLEFTRGARDALATAFADQVARAEKAEAVMQEVIAEWEPRTWNCAVNAEDVVPDLHEGMITIKFGECVQMATWGDRPEMVAITLGGVGDPGGLLVVPRSAVVALTGWRP